MAFMSTPVSAAAPAAPASTVPASTPASAVAPTPLPAIAVSVALSAPAAASRHFFVQYKCFCWWCEACLEVHSKAATTWSPSHTKP